MTTREAFEAFISAPPFEMPIERFDDRSAWPGSYTELEVDLAWQAWQAATAAALERAAQKVEPPRGTEAIEVIGGEDGPLMLRELAAEIRALKEQP